MSSFWASFPKVSVRVVGKEVVVVVVVVGAASIVLDVVDASFVVVSVKV